MHLFTCKNRVNHSRSHSTRFRHEDIVTRGTKHQNGEEMIYFKGDVVGGARCLSLTESLWIKGHKDETGIYHTRYYHYDSTPNQISEGWQPLVRPSTNILNSQTMQRGQDVQSHQLQLDSSQFWPKTLSL